MILYLDPSALVKRYVAEVGSVGISAAISRASTAGTALISRAEVVAALARAVRVSALTTDEALASLQVFRTEWPDLVRVQVSELVVARADTFAWEYGLRGYDAVHLAAASVWQDAIGDRLTFATFDRHLWAASETAGLSSFPPDLPTMLEQWKPGRAPSSSLPR